MRKLLVTGGAGFIGSNFVRYWLSARADAHVVVLDALTYAGNLANLATVLPDPRLRFVHGDITDERCVAELLRQHQLDTVVHFAAESHVDRSIHGPDAFVDTNIVGTHSLLKAARRVWLDEGAVPGPHRFHHVSTDEVYGSLGPTAPAFTERSQYAPNSPYAATKAASDHLVRAYHHTYALPVTVTNCSNNYGGFQFPEKLIPLMIVNALRGETLPVYGDGLHVRDWLHVDDHSRAIERVLDRGRIGEVYNVGGASERANVDIVRLICTTLDALFRHDPALAVRYPACPPATGRDCDELIRFVTDRPGHDRRYAIDGTKIASELGFRPTETFESGLTRTVDWYVRNPEWWSAVLDGSYQHGPEARDGAPGG
jgi:dTDP-glucose 4,6-dehydratase